MSSVHRFIPNNLNEVADAEIVASSVKPISNSVRLLADQMIREGNGLVRVTGAFTGHNSKTRLDIQITSAVGGESLISKPVAKCVGTGAISEISVSDDLVPQDFTAQLVSLGTETVKASADFMGVKLVAKTAGTPGNAVTVSISRNGLVATPTVYATLEAIAEGTVDLPGDQWDYGGAYALDGYGNLNPLTKRILLGADLQVYRLYRTFEEGKWIFHLTPKAVRAVPAGTKVKEVTGSYVATITGGATTETYSGVTIFDILSQIQLLSTLVDIDGVVAEDKRPGGMASLDAGMVTQPYVLPIRTAGSSYVTKLKNDDLAIVPLAGSPTEEISLSCVSNADVGAELWDVVGSVRGSLGQATTGKLFSNPLVSFRVPKKDPPDSEEQTTWEFFYVERGTEEPSAPEICPKEIKPGVASGALRVKLEYRVRPTVTGDCGCNEDHYEGHVSDACLGLTEDPEYGGGEGVLFPKFKRALFKLYEWYAKYTEDNTRLLRDSSAGADGDRVTALLLADRTDLAAADGIVDLFANYLNQQQLDADFVAINSAAAWAAGAEYAEGDIRKPLASDNGMYYVCTKEGTSGASEPTFPEEIADTVTDGTTEWVCMGFRSLWLFDTVFEQMKTEMAVVGDHLDVGDFWNSVQAGVVLEKPKWETGKAYVAAVEAIVVSEIWPTTYDGFKYQAVQPGGSGASEPVWDALVGAYTQDGEVAWKAILIAISLPATWAANTNFLINTYCKPTVFNGFKYRRSASGNTGATEPSWPEYTGGTTGQDGSATTYYWTAEVLTDIIPWIASRKQAVGNYIHPTQYNGYKYKCVQAGTTDSSEPAWSGALETVTDGTVKWVAEIWAEQGDIWQAETQYNIASLEVVASEVQPTKYNGCFYECVQSGTSGASEPEFPAIVGVRVTDGAAIWECKAKVATTPSDDIAIWLKRYEAMLKKVKSAGNIEPPFSQASEGNGAVTSVGTAPCWQDIPDADYWFVATIEGGVAENYKPLFPNVPWVSCTEIAGPDGKPKVVCTKEIGLVLDINPVCIANLKAGDTVYIYYNGAAKAYQKNDTITIPVIHASPLQLSGGINGDNTRIWRVTGSEFGAFPSYSQVLPNPSPYLSNGLGLLITEGGIPHALGDAYSFTKEGGLFRERWDSGVWGTEKQILADGVSIGNGLTAYFDRGAKPSFLAGDFFPFEIIQLYSSAHIASPKWRTWQWEGAAVYVDIAFGAVKTLTGFMLVHELPGGAEITLIGETDSVTSFTLPLPWRENIIAVFPDPAVTADTIRLNLTHAEGGKIRWLWCGSPFIPALNSTSMRLNRQYAMKRGGGLNPSGAYLGKGRGGQIAWEDWFSQADQQNLDELLDHVKRAGDEPIGFCPNVNHPEEATLVLCDFDSLDVQDRFQFQPTDESKRMLSVSLPLMGVYF